MGVCPAVSMKATPKSSPFVTNCTLELPGHFSYTQTSDKSELRTKIQNKWDAMELSITLQYQ